MLEERSIRPAVLDELPVGRGQHQILEEYPPGILGYDPMQQDQQQPSEIPLKVRMKSKIVKQRLSAYEEIIKAMADEDYAAIEVNSNDLIGFISDSSLNAQEKGLQLSITWMEKHSSDTFDMKELAKVTIEKALVQSKPQIRRFALDLLVHLFERGGLTAVLESILLCSCQKNPKIVCASIQTIIELLTQFGFKKCEQLKGFWSKAEELSQSQQSIVKNEAIAFYKEAGKWMGRAIEGKIQKLKKEQQEEILRSVDAIPEGTVMKPLRGDAEDAVSLKDLKDFDAYEHVEAVDALSKYYNANQYRYPDSWCERVLAAEKWLEKKELLEVLLKSVQVTRIHPNVTNLYPIVQMLKKLLNYNNVAIHLLTIKVAGCLAGGLRKNFCQSAKILLSPLLQKLKDKKQQVIDEVNTTIKKFFYVLPLDDLMDDIKEVLEDKAWGARVNAIAVIEFYIETQTKQAILKQGCVRTLPQLLKKYMEDGSVEVREKTILVLGKLQGKVYEGSLKKELADIKPDKLNKINQIAQGYVSKDEKPLNDLTNCPPEPVQKVQKQQQPISRSVDQPAQKQQQQQQQHQQQTHHQPQQQQPQQQQPQQQQPQQQQPHQFQPPQLNPQPQHHPPQQQMACNIKNDVAKPLQAQRMIEEPIRPQSVFQNKEQRIQLEVQNPFPINTLGDSHIDTLKQMFQLPGVPVTLYRDLFSMNQNAHLRSIRYIRQKLNRASELSDILIKWAFSIGWFRESVQLQCEILQFLNFLLFQLRQEHYEIHSTELRIIKGYLHMLVYLLCRANQTLMAQRTLPVVMQILQSNPSLPSMFVKDGFRFDEDEDPSRGETSRKAKILIEHIGNRLGEWSLTDCSKNRLIISDIVSHISSPKPTPVTQPSVILIEAPPQPATDMSARDPSPIITEAVKPVSPLLSARLIQPHVQSPHFRVEQNKPKSEHYHIVSEQVRQFQVMARQLLNNEPSAKTHSSYLIDLAITIGVTLFQLRDQPLIVEYFVEIENIMTCDLSALPYQKFFEFIQWMFNQILKEVATNTNQKEIKDTQEDPNKAQNEIMRLLNGAMVKILVSGDVTNVYLSLMDIIIRERSTNQNLQILQRQISLCTRCLNKVLGNTKMRLQSASLSMILDRFNAYLSRFCNFPDGCPPDNTRRGDDILAKAIKTAILLFVKQFGQQELMNVLDQLKLPPQSHLNRWVMENDLEDDTKNITSLASKRLSLLRHMNQTDPGNGKMIFESLNRNDDGFDKALEQLVLFLKRNKGYDWKSQVNCDHPRLKHIEEKIEWSCIDVHVNLEKKVVELAVMKETMHQ